MASKESNKINYAKAVDEYFEYTRNVGKDDGGKLMTPAEYEAYKAKMDPQREKNRLFVSWTNGSGMDCILVGPQSLCFCTHRYINHKTDYASVPTQRPVPTPCQEKGCVCAGFQHLPRSGGGPIRCSGCKHPGDVHSAGSGHKCRNKGGCTCSGFRSSHTCSCGEPYSAHQMIIETRQEREKRCRVNGEVKLVLFLQKGGCCSGKPVGREVGYQAMGGITGFSSLAEGYLRLDASGAGEATGKVLRGADSHTLVKAIHPASEKKPKKITAKK